MIVLDTNVLSEPARPLPSIAVRQWLAGQDLRELFTTAITEAEMLAGVAVMPAGRRRDAIASQVELIFTEDFKGRILTFDEAAAREMPAIASAARGGAPLVRPDIQIAAIARSRGAMLATRNFKEFLGYGLTLINPWTGERR